MCVRACCVPVPVFEHLYAYVPISVSMSGWGGDRKGLIVTGGKQTGGRAVWCFLVLLSRNFVFKFWQIRAILDTRAKFFPPENSFGKSSHES